MLSTLLYLFGFIVCAFSAGEVTFLHFPQSISFEGDDPVQQSDLKEVFSLSLGFTPNEGSDWKGFVLKNPFHLAEAIVVVVVDGVYSVGFKGHSYPVVTDEDEYVTWKALQSKIWQRFPWENSTQVRIDFNNIQSTANYVQSELGTLDINPSVISTDSLDQNNTEDIEFLRECSLLLDVADKVQSVVSRDGTPDVYWFLVRGLHAVLDVHGPDSPAAWEAKQLLRDTVADVMKEFNTCYNGEVLMATITTDASHTRHRRAVEGGPDTGNNTAKNLAKVYSDNYPAIFNIILWFMLAFVFSIIAVAVGTASMDPGRDSIIYRMTSNRMKKDN